MSKVVLYRSDVALKAGDQQSRTSHCGMGQSVAKIMEYLAGSDKVLDVACDAGRRACDLAQFVKHVVGIDDVEEKIRMASNRAEQSDLFNVQFRVADIFEESLRDHKFNAILAFNALSFDREPAEIMERLNSLLNVNGKLLLSHKCLADGRSLLRNVRFIFSRLGFVEPCPQVSVAELENWVSCASFHIKEESFINPLTGDYFIFATKQ